jgi:hypothetical protein
MAVLDQIGQEKQRLSQRLMLVDAERAKLVTQLDELEIAERALQRFGGKAVATEGQGKRRAGGRASRAVSKGRDEGGALNGRQAPKVPLRDAALKAVQAHAKGANANELIEYLSQKFGLTVRPNHLGMALQRHRRAGRLEQRDRRWYLPRLT